MLTMPDSVLVLGLLAAIGGVVFQQFRLVMMRAEREREAYRALALLRQIQTYRSQAEEARAHLAVLQRAHRNGAHR